MIPVIGWNKQEGVLKLATAPCNSVPSVVVGEVNSVLSSLLSVRQGGAEVDLPMEEVCALGKQELSWPKFGHWEEFWSTVVFDTFPLGNKEDNSLLHEYKETVGCFLPLWKFSTLVTQDSCGPKDANEIQPQ